ncbi:hypothetical protein VUR80DRAFT_6436 [Thermomyces stellatus]
MDRTMGLWRSNSMTPTPEPVIITEDTTPGLILQKVDYIAPAGNPSRVQSTRIDDRPESAALKRAPPLGYMDVK